MEKPNRKKLFLKKRTVSFLSESQMDKVLGATGDECFSETCPGDQGCGDQTDFCPTDTCPAPTDNCPPATSNCPTAVTCNCPTSDCQTDGCYSDRCYTDAYCDTGLICSY